MSAKFVLTAIACVCWFFAAIPYEPMRPWSTNVGWLGMLFFGLSFIVS